MCMWKKTRTKKTQQQSPKMKYSYALLKYALLKYALLLKYVLLKYDLCSRKTCTEFACLPLFLAINFSWLCAASSDHSFQNNRGCKDGSIFPSLSLTDTTKVFSSSELLSYWYCLDTVLHCYSLEKDLSEQMQSLPSWLLNQCYAPDVQKIRYTDTKRGKRKVSRPSFQVLPEYTFAFGYIHNKLYLSSQGNEPEQIVIHCTSCTFTSYFSTYEQVVCNFLPSPSSIE